MKGIQSSISSQNVKQNKFLKDMIEDSKKAAQKQLNTISQIPKSVKELDQITQNKRKELGLGGTGGGTASIQHANKNKELIQAQMDKNQLLLEKAQQLQQRLEATNKKFQETQQRIAPAKDSLAKRDLQNSKLVPLESKPLYPNTILQTNNPEEVKQVIELMIAQQQCQSVQEQSVLNYNLLFKDPDFGPEAQYNPLYFEGDLDQKLAQELEFSLRKLSWMRPQEIAPMPKMAGFTELDLSKASQEEILSMKSDYKIHGHRIIQGKLEDRWFLSSLSMIAAEQKVFDQMICREEGFYQYRKYGVYVFRFFKNGQLYYVIIDDRLPCLQKDNGQPVPFFARCENSNLFWVSLLEKAFAKLHGRYYALLIGTPEEAIQDMIGIYPETVYIDPQQNTNKDNLFNSLRVLSYNHCILGCKLDFEMFPSLDQEKKQNSYRQAQLKGIQQRFFYTILDVREVKTEERGAEPSQVHKLVRLKNPWANSQEWNGAFSDVDPVWNQDLKSKFNNMNVLDGYSDNERYIHRWNVEDGIFVIKLDDFVEMFNCIIIGRDYPDSYFGVKFEDEWAPSFGFPHPKNPDWLRNKQFIFTFDNPLVKEVRVTAIIQQNDPRFITQLHPPFKDHRVNIGLIVLKMNKIEDRVKFYDTNKKVLIKKTQPSRSVECSFTITQGKYCIIPLTKYSNDVQKYQLKFYFNCQPADIIFETKPFKIILDNNMTQDIQETSISKKDLLNQLNNKFYDAAKPGDNKQIIKSALPDRSTAALASNILRTSIFRPDNEQIKKQIGSNQFVWNVMTPFELESIINPPSKVDLKKRDQNTVSDAKRYQQMLGDFYEEDENDFGCRLYDQDFDQLQAFERNQILIGIDPDDPDETQKGKTKEQINKQSDIHRHAVEMTKDELDLSYYYIGQDGFHAILPQLEQNYLSWITKLNVAGNGLSDFSIIELVDSLKQIHNQTLEYLDISDNKISDQGIQALIDLCSKNRSLKEIVTEGLTDPSPNIMTRLETALKKNQMGLPDSKIDQMYQTAKQVDQAMNYHLQFV
ncbi:cysteine protease family c02 [Stylonychia lemnae]|uniref:Cysteine protease family c02 n=1 Tax=Stylonychia lemnae TaxID=5949 RepID=A0A078B5K1_STYLE|nr:cysteine protease family c02 [Stylonychia lemnae]|eukprot:CDW89694.1 cysteine protease family c02 [Stylonychia lemnae]